MDQEFSSADELANAIINQKDSIKEQIKKQTTETKLTKLFTDWKNENDLIEKLLNNKGKNIKTTGGTNANNGDKSRRIGVVSLWYQ